MEDLAQSNGTCSRSSWKGVELLAGPSEIPTTSWQSNARQILMHTIHYKSSEDPVFVFPTGDVATFSLSAQQQANTESRIQGDSKRPFHVPPRGNQEGWSS